MRMCEYANNITDMALLFYSIEENNRRIVNDEEYYDSGLFNAAFFITFPHKYINFIRLGLKYYRDYTVSFARVNKLYFVLEIYYGW
jgi:hypothetical protein